MYDIDIIRVKDNFFVEFNKYNDEGDREKSIIIEPYNNFHSVTFIDADQERTLNIKSLYSNSNYYELISKVYSNDFKQYTYQNTVQTDKDGYYINLPFSKYQIYIDKKYACFKHRRHLLVMNGCLYIDKFYTLDNGNIVNIHYESNKINSITVMKDTPIEMNNINNIDSYISYLSHQPKTLIMNDNIYNIIYDKYGVMKSCKINSEEYCQYNNSHNSIVSIHPLIFDNFFMENIGEEIMVCDIYDFDEDYEHFGRTILT